MKIAKVEHERCGDYDCTTYVWVPDEMTTEQFGDAVDRAQKAYLAYAEEWSRTKEVESPGFAPDYKSNPDKTVREVEADFAQRRAAYDEWQNKRSKAKRSFAHYLESEGIKRIWDHDPEMTYELSWGHRHGSALDYEAPIPPDYPPIHEDKPIARQF